MHLGPVARVPKMSSLFPRSRKLYLLVVALFVLLLVTVARSSRAEAPSWPVDPTGYVGWHLHGDQLHQHCLNGMSPHNTTHGQNCARPTATPTRERRSSETTSPRPSAPNCDRSAPTGRDEASGIVARYEGCTLVLEYKGIEYYWLPGYSMPVVTPTPGS